VVAQRRPGVYPIAMHGENEHLAQVGLGDVHHQACEERLIACGKRASVSAECAPGAQRDRVQQ